MLKSTACIGVIMLATLVLSADALQAQRDISGKSWIRMEAKEKLAYLAGFYAGLKSDSRVAAKADRKSTRLNSSHIPLSRMPSSA